MRNVAIGIFSVLFSFPYGGCDGPGPGGEFAAPAMTQGPADPGPKGMDPTGGEFTIKYPKVSSAFFDNSSVIEVDISFTDASTPTAMCWKRTKPQPTTVICGR